MTGADRLVIEDALGRNAPPVQIYDCPDPDMLGICGFAGGRQRYFEVKAAWPIPAQGEKREACIRQLCRAMAHIRAHS